MQTRAIFWTVGFVDCLNWLHMLTFRHNVNHFLCFQNWTIPFLLLNFAAPPLTRAIWIRFGEVQKAPLEQPQSIRIVIGLDLIIWISDEKGIDLIHIISTGYLHQINSRETFFSTPHYF
jgi:hypothetical protein